MKEAFVNINGSISPAADAKISVFDRGFLYGDSIYEVVRTYRGQFYTVDEHLARLEKSAELCRMILAQSASQLKQEIKRTFETFQTAFPGKEAYLRIIITRGIGEIGFGLEKLRSESQMILIVQPVEEPSAEARRKGCKLAIVSRLRNSPRALDPAMKSGNYLNSVLAYLEAASEGYDDALMCDASGNLTEGTTFNLFYVKNGIVVTPTLKVGILEGITRRKVIDIARKLGREVREVDFPAETLMKADEVFVTGTVKEVLGVSHLNGESIGAKAHRGAPGPVTLQLAQAYQAEIQAWLKTLEKRN